MNTKWFKTMAPGIMAAGMIFCACTTHTTTGPGSETVAIVVVGRVVDSLGQPAPQTLVMLLPALYNPMTDPAIPDSMIGITNETGHYAMKARGPGGYSVEASDFNSNRKALVTGINAGGKDTVSVPESVLRMPGALRVVLQDTADEASGYIYLPGTTCYGRAQSGIATVSAVPAGPIPALNYANTAAPAMNHVVQTNVTVRSNDTLVITDMTPWKYLKKLSLNTSAGGAGVAGDVFNFPVLLRLTISNFNFSQAKNDGGDLRFAKSNGTLLPYEIERWDPTAGLAEVWVKVDTVRGNDSAQSLMMYWGNATAAHGSNGAAVFDSVGGFAGVWHLCETSGTLAADASYNGFSGVYIGKIPENVAGPFGICQYFAPSDSDYVDMGDVLNPGMKNITIGVWIKRASFGLPQALIAKTVGGAPSATYGYQLSIDQANFPHFFMASGGTGWGNDSAFDIAGNLALSDSTAWHFVLVVIDRSINGNCRVYIDGIDRTGGAYGNVAHVDNVTNTLRLRIGSENNTYHFYRGAIGEATIAFTVRSADWVKLSYMNQKEQDALVKW